MKRTLFTSLALTVGLAAGVDAQNRYGYRSDRGDDCDYVERRHEPVRYPILNRLAGDLRVAGEEIDQGLFEMRDELRRLFRGGGARYYRDHYHHDDRYHDDRFYDGRYGEEHYYRDDPSRTAAESFGRFSPEMLERARRRGLAEREHHERREAAIRRDLQRGRDATRRELEDRRRDDHRHDHRNTPADSGDSPPVIVRPRPEPKRELEPPRESERHEDATASSAPAPPLPTTREPIAESDRKAPVSEKRSTGSRTFSEAEKRNFPLATKTDKPGFVRSPYPPFELLDVSGFEPGGLAMEPSTDRIFRIPK